MPAAARCESVCVSLTPTASASRELGQDLGPQPGVGPVQRRAADAAVRPRHAGRQTRGAAPCKAPARPCRACGAPDQPLLRPGLEVGDGRLHLFGWQQHHGGLPGAAGEDLAADVHQPMRVLGPVQTQPRQRLDSMPTEAAQVALGQAGEHQLPPGHQGGRDVRKQQIAEVVAIEGAEEDDGQTRRAIVHENPRARLRGRITSGESRRHQAVRRTAARPDRRGVRARRAG